MEEIKTTVANNTENAQRANQLAFSAKDTASKGAEVMQDVAVTMRHIEESTQKFLISRASLMGSPVKPISWLLTLP